MAATAANASPSGCLRQPDRHGMFLRINNVRILSISFDGVISRFAGMPYPEELLVPTAGGLDHLAIVGCDGYHLREDWEEFAMSGATVIAQASFWLGNCKDKEQARLYINRETVPRFRKVPKISKAGHLNQFVQTHLISNSTGAFQYHGNKRQHLKFGRAQDSTDFNFVRTLYMLLARHVMPLNPTRVIDPDGTKRGVLVLGMLWLEKAVQIMLRLRQMGLSDERSLGVMIDELQKAYRLREESVADLLGTCVPDTPWVG
jgi:hypothetical protein